MKWVIPEANKFLCNMQHANNRKVFYRAFLALRRKEVIGNGTLASIPC